MRGSNSIVQENRLKDKCTGKGRARWRLVEQIVKLSEARTWHEAKHEWVFSHLFRNEEFPGECLCGKRHLLDRCVLYNKFNDHVVIVGTTCVKRFLDTPLADLVSDIQRISKSLSARPGKQLVEYALKRGALNDYEYKFCQDTLDKTQRQLKGKQPAFRQRLNERFLRLVAQTEEGVCHG